MCTHWLPHADNLNVMEVLASADEAMPALAARLAGADPASAASSASAVTSQTPAPGDLAGKAEGTIAKKLESRLISVAILQTTKRQNLQPMRASVQAYRDAQEKADIGKLSCNHVQCTNI